MKKNKRSCDYICQECGAPFLTPQQREDCDRIHTYHFGRCGLCNVEKGITHMRNYNYLNKNYRAKEV